MVQFRFCFIPFSFANVIKFEEKENKIWTTNKIKPQHCQSLIKMYFLHYFSTGKRYNDRHWFGVDLMGVQFNWRPWLLTKNMTNNKPFLMPFTLHKIIIRHVLNKFYISIANTIASLKHIASTHSNCLHFLYMYIGADVVGSTQKFKSRGLWCTTRSKTKYL